MSKKKKIALIFASLLLIIVTVFVVIGAQIWSFGTLDKKTDADVIIVLGTKVSGDKPSPVFAERINHGIWLYKNGYAGSIIFTGGVGKDATVSEAAAAREYAVLQGVDPNDIFIEEASTITEENFFEAKKIMDRQGFSSAIVVSDPLHQKRAMLMAEDYGIENAYSSPTPTSAYKTFKTKVGFLLREQVMYIGYCIVRIFR